MDKPNSTGVARLPNPPVDFLLTHYDDELHLPVNEQVVAYSKSHDLWVGETTAKRLKEQEEALFSSAKKEMLALQEAIRTIKTPPGAKPVKEDNVKCSWAVVISDLEKLAVEEQNDDSHTKKARSLFRKIGDNAPVFEQWLNLLPDGDYGSIIGGAFNLFISSAKRANEVRNSAYEALADIPDCIRQASEYMDIYQSRRPLELVKKTAELCSAVLVALRSIVLYFGTSLSRRFFEVLTLGPNYKAEMLQKIDQVKQLASKMDKEALIASQRSLQMLETSVGKVNATVQAGFEGLQSEVYKKNLADELSEAVASKLLPGVYEMFVNAMYNTLASSPIYDHSNGRLVEGVKLLRSAISSESLAITLPDSDSIITTAALIKMLEPSPDFAKRDMQWCLDNVRTLDLVDQDRVKWTMVSPKLRKWLMETGSRVLLINGNSDPNEILSPMTFFAAKLLATLQEIKPVISIHFFCALHTSTLREAHGNVSGLMRCLLTQLLKAREEWDLSFLDETSIERLKENHIESLCELFHKLLAQLVEGSVLFCVLDAITFYERSDKRADFLIVMRKLVSEIDPSRKISFKLLLTCPSRSSFVMKLLQAEDVLLVNETVDGDYQGWSENVWNRSIGLPVQNLRISDQEETDERADKGHSRI